MTIYPTITLQAPGLDDLTLDATIGVYGQTLDLGDAATRAVVSDAPDADGTDDTTEFVGARSVTLDVTVVPHLTGPSLWTLRQAIRAFTAPKLRPVMLVQQSADAPMQRIVLRRNQFSDTIGGGPAADTAKIVVQWIAPTGILESEQIYEQAVPASGGAGFGASFDLVFPIDWGPSAPIGSAAVVNAGDADARPLLRIYGPCDNPAIHNLTQGKQIAFVGLTIPAGEYLEIDTRLHTVFYQGVATDSRYEYVDFPTSAWWTLSPGDNEILFAPAAYSEPSLCLFIYRDASL